MQNWKILGKIKPNEDKRIEAICKIILANRKIKTTSQISEFLNPPLPQDYSLKKLEINPSEMKKGTSRIIKAVKNNEKIIVYTDYDTDGICGGAIIWETLNSIGANVLPYVPERDAEGYGLSIIGLNKILENNFYTRNGSPSLIITVDHGITAFEAIKEAKKRNIDVIVCDHHLKDKKEVEADAIIHTIKLCGAGVAWYLAREILSTSFYRNIFYQALLNDLLDLAAIATIADMVPLTGANRSLVESGLSIINKTKRLGLIEIIKEAGLSDKKITPYEISFIISPRLNAMGRLVQGLDALRLLCAKNQVKAQILAEKLGLVNQERQKLTAETLIHAKKTLSEQNFSEEKLIFLSHRSYNAGIIGLVAGKLVDEYYLPAIVIAENEVYSKASARSISGYNIIEQIRSASQILVNSGGHPMAAGFTVETKKIEELKTILTKQAKEQISDEQLIKQIKIDCALEINDLDKKLYKKIQEMAPFGIGNPEPIFCIKNIKISNFQLVGQNKNHLKLFFVNGKLPGFVAIGFNMGDFADQIDPSAVYSVAFTLSNNIWNQQENLQLKIKDIKIEKNE